MRQHNDYSSQAYVQRQRVGKHGPSNQQQNRRHLVIFDWDDTLYPTSYVFQLTSDDKEKQQTEKAAVRKGISAHELHRFAKSAYFVLRRFIEAFGAQSIVIVTNAKKGWVMHSLIASSALYQQTEPRMIGLDFFALIRELLLAREIPIISAHHLFHERYPQTPTMWKTFAFKQLAKRRFNVNSHSNRDCQYVLLSIGDSEAEYVAAFETKRMIETKTRLNRSTDKIQLLRVKLRSCPNIDHMVLQNQHLLKVAEKFAPPRKDNSERQ